MGWRWRRIGLVALVAVALVIAWEPSRVGIQTAALLPNLLDAGPKPLNLASRPPLRSTVPYWPQPPVDVERSELGELWLPAWASSDRRAGAMLLVFGINNLGRNHPAIVRVAEALARTGVVVLVPDSRSMLEGRLNEGETEKVAAAFDLLASRPEVDTGRVGIVGFSVGGSLALAAAADPSIADRVAWVNAFGAYADAATYLASVASHAYIGVDGGAVAWQPTPLARQIFVDFMLDQVDRRVDRRALQEAYANVALAGDRPSPDRALRDSLGSDGRAVHDLLTAPSWEAARAAVDALPASTQSLIREISPVQHLAAVRTKVYLMHEVDDQHVPYVESVRLAETLEAAGLLEQYTQFRLFDHVQPDDLDLAAAAPELWKLLWHVQGLMLETL